MLRSGYNGGFSRQIGKGKGEPMRESEEVSADAAVTRTGVGCSADRGRAWGEQEHREAVPAPGWLGRLRAGGACWGAGGACVDTRGPGWRSASAVTRATPRWCARSCRASFRWRSRCARSSAPVRRCVGNWRRRRGRRCASRRRRGSSCRSTSVPGGSRSAANWSGSRPLVQNGGGHARVLPALLRAGVRP